MSRTSIAKARRTLALPPEIVRMAEIAEAIVAAAEGVREVADVDAGAADVMAAAVVVAGMAVAGTAGEGTNFPQINFVSADFADLEKGLRLWSRSFSVFGGHTIGKSFLSASKKFSRRGKCAHHPRDLSTSFDYRVPCSAAENIADMRAGHSRASCLTLANAMAG